MLALPTERAAYSSDNFYKHLVPKGSQSGELHEDHETDDCESDIALPDRARGPGITQEKYARNEFAIENRDH